MYLSLHVSQHKRLCVAYVYVPKHQLICLMLNVSGVYLFWTYPQFVMSFHCWLTLQLWELASPYLDVTVSQLWWLLRVTFTTGWRWRLTTIPPRLLLTVWKTSVIVSVCRVLRVCVYACVLVCHVCVVSICLSVSVSECTVCMCVVCTRVHACVCVCYAEHINCR